MFSLESFSWILGSLDQILEKSNNKQLLYDLLKLIEKEKSLLGVSPHILAKCNKKLKNLL